MMNKKMLGLVGIIFLISCGPSNYEDCILQNMRGGHTKLGEWEITKACREKFSVNKHLKGRKLSQVGLSKLTAGLSPAS